MTCNDPNCKGCQYNRFAPSEAIKNIHLTPGITALQAATQMGLVICLQAQAAADASEAGLFKALGMGQQAREIEMDTINEFMRNDRNGVNLYAAFTQILAVFADKIDRATLVEAVYQAFKAADEKFFPNGEDGEPATNRDSIIKIVDDFVDNFLESCLARGRETVQQRADELGLDLQKSKMMVNDEDRKASRH